MSADALGRQKARQRRFIVLMLAPAAFFFIVFAAVPSVRALIYSFQKWDGLSDPEWAGWSNFRTLLSDDLFFPALSNNVILMIGAGSITMLLALFFAAALHRRVRGAGLFRVVFFFPNVIAAVAIALLWLMLYSTSGFGMVNGILLWLQEHVNAGFREMFYLVLRVRLGIEGNLDEHLPLIESILGNLELAILRGQLPFAFTESSRLIYALIPMMVWTAVGFYMVLFLAAMEGIPEELYEAARLDGARAPGQFWHVTLPLIREVLVVGIVFFVISTAKFFDAVWVMESQYPTRDSHVLATVLYQKVFTEYNVGYAAAVAVVLFALVFCATLFTLRWSRREALEY